MDNIDYSIVIPVYYNQGELIPLMRSLTTLVFQANPGRAGELIFVDDGSGDGSIVELRQIQSEFSALVTIIKLTRNFGAVHASKTGLQFVTGDCFLILAADLQDPPELILEMIKRWQTGAKFVLCARAHRNDPLLSKFFSSIYYRLVRLFVVKDYPKGGFDLALMDRAFLPHLSQQF